MTHIHSKAQTGIKGGAADVVGTERIDADHGGEAVVGKGGGWGRGQETEEKADDTCQH